MDRDRKFPRLVEAPSSAGMAPPHDLDAEASCLSAMMLKATAVAEVRDEIDLVDFFSEHNRRICEVCFWLDDNHQPLDIRLIASRLKDTGQLEQIGGARYLKDIIDATPAVWNVRHHARIVRRKAVSRRRIAAAHTANAFQYGSPFEEHEEHLQALREALDEPEHKHVESTRSSLGAALASGLASLMDQHAAKGSGILGVSTGIASIDALTGGLHASQTVYVSAPSGNGKTSFAAQLALTIAQQSEPHATEKTKDAEALRVPYGVAVFTFEMTREEYALKMACSHACVEYQAIQTGRATQQDWARLRGAQIEIADLPIQIDDCSKLTTRDLERRIEKVDREMAAQGVMLRAVIIDQMGLMEPAVAPSKSATDERIAWQVGKEIRDINLTKRGKKMTIVVLSQENARGKLARSGALREHAVVWLSLKVDKTESDGSWRSKRYPAEATCKKQRFGECGAPIPLWFDGPTTKFSDGAEQRVMRLPKATVLKEPPMEPPPDFSFNALDEESPL